MPLTFRVKAKRYPWWHYAAAAVFSVLGSAFWAWLAHTGLGFPLPVAWQVFFVFSGVALLSLCSMYIAYRRQFRNHSSRAVPRVATASAASISYATLYFVAKSDLAQGKSTVKIITVIFAAVSIAIGAFVSLFLIRYEVE